jgi:hypothetical protein
MKITIPSLYIGECRHIKVTKKADIGSIWIDFDEGVLVIVAASTDDMAMPELEVVEENETGQ